ncbi:MAG: hypothetical protein CL529_11955 [Aequorivita sp.]|nr:hypothetical protein [Aequorivita sp.]|tara:strand:+ start:27936 stop:28694 length:759 start_codon:yes stop_codon:yes gene_type:complete
MGFVKLHRELSNWEWADSPNHLSVFINLLLRVNYQPKTWRGIEVNAGEVITGRKKIAEWTGIKESTVFRVLKDLETCGELNIKKTNKYSIISMVKWSQFQLDEQQENNKRTTNEQQMNTTKERKERKERKEYINTSENPTERIDYEFYSNCWNTLTVNILPQVTRMTDARKRALKILIRNTGSQDFKPEFESLVKKVLESDFLSGKNSAWHATFDWCLKSANYTKIIEGNYKNKNGSNAGANDLDAFMKGEL